MVEVLGELCGTYHQVSKIEEKEKSLLMKYGINVERSDIHDAAGINDDYPVGRGVFIEEQNEFVVLVNFEDHIQIIMLPETGRFNNVRRSIQRMEKLTKTFDKMGFATDSYLGFLTVSPANLGTGMAFTATQVLDGKKRTRVEVESIRQILNEGLSQAKGMVVDVEEELSETDRMEGVVSAVRVKFSTKQTLAPNYNESIQIEDFLWAMKRVSEFDE